MKVCAQPGCPDLTDSTYCPAHKPKAWASSTRRERVGKSGWQQQADAQRILRRDRHLCQIQGPHCTGHATEVDHIVPTFEGGTDTDNNKQPACPACHRAKTQQEAARARTARTTTPRG